jgi:FMN phosphatase YigB (HAD superfamily)
MLVVDDFIEFMKPLDEAQYDELQNQVSKIGYGVFDHHYEPIEGAIEAVRALQEFGRVVIYTMGDRLEQVKKIASLGLSDLDFEIYDFKDETVYRNLKHRYPAHNYVMIGDSYSRDITPAIKVGMRGYYVKSDREEFWYNQTEPLHPNTICVDHIQEVLVDLSEKKELIGNKGKELWYPTYAPHVDLETGKSILDEIYAKYPEKRRYR